MVRHAGGKIEPLQTGIHLLQQPLRRIRPGISQRVSQASRIGTNRLETIIDGSWTIAEYNLRIASITLFVSIVIHIIQCAFALVSRKIYTIIDGVLPLPIT